MDVLRSFHTSTAWIGSDNATTAEIRWYPCAEGAKAFPAFHAFGNPVWEPSPDDWTRGPGVETPLLKWASSRYDAPAGQEYHGQLAWYQKGIPQAVFDNPAPWEHEPCVPAIVPDVCNIRLAPVAIDPDIGRLRVDFLDYTF